MSEKKVGMSTAVNWQNEIATIAGPYTGNRKGWLARASLRAGTTFRVIKGLYYGEYNNPSHETAQKILTAADKARLQEAREDAFKVADYFNRHAAALASIDPDFHGPEIDALIAAARAISGRDRS